MEARCKPSSGIAICPTGTCPARPISSRVPANGLLDMATYARELEARPQPAGTTAAERKDRRTKLNFARTDHWLDTASAVRHFDSAELARTVAESMLRFAGERYDLLAFAVMPSHFHWVFRPLSGWVESLGPSIGIRPPRERIMHSLKSYTAGRCNRLLGLRGHFWQDESYDRCVRDEGELERIIEYVESNPVKAGLVARPAEWEFSSSALRSRGAIPLGEPLRP